MTTRRSFCAAASAFALIGCSGAPTAHRQTHTAWPSAPNPGFDAWVISFQKRARRQGISDATLSKGMSAAQYLPGVIARDRNQTEFKRSLEDYIAIAASDTRVREGQSALEQHARVLRAIESQFGVEKHVICAIWGLESKYGARRGEVPVLSALATLAYDGRRGQFFEAQLIAALQILDTGDTRPGKMVGSWAGAMGHTQFIPTSYQSFAVDFDRDGRRDIWSEDPTDALASTASYLARNGWRKGQPWGVEVSVPKSYSGPEGRSTRSSISSWNARGLRTMTGTELPNFGAAAFIRPAGPNAPAFVVFDNFRVLLSYNNATNYAIGVGHLSDRINGALPLKGPFPPDEFGFSLEDRKRLQTALTRAGFDAGDADGVFGTKTKAAISAYQRAKGLPITGLPSRDLLRRL